MTSPWVLPRRAEFDGCVYDLNGDFRDVLEIMAYLQDPALPEFIRWQVALGLFYRQEVAPCHSRQAMEYLAWFLNGGCQEENRSGPKLLDWQQDAGAIISDVNRISGQEIRALPFLHWWTFLSWFHGIGQGQVSALVSVRDKLRRGKKLEGWEKEFYSANRDRVRLRHADTPQQLREKQELEKLLG